MTNRFALPENQPLTCRTCRHWYGGPKDPNNIGAPQPGECREGPPHLTMIQIQGGFAQISAYPNPGENFSACDRHEVAVAIENGD